MKLFSFLAFGLVSLAAAEDHNKFTFERLDKNDAALLIVDIQEGLYQLVRDSDPTLYKQQALAHAALGKAFDLPVVMTSSADQGMYEILSLDNMAFPGFLALGTCYKSLVRHANSVSGPNGPLMAEILDMYPDSPLIQRHGEVDAWDNEAFRAAVGATNKSQIILAGITTDVCTTFLALSLRSEGYSVWANVEASGTSSALVRDISNVRMAQAGVQTVSLFSIFGDLMRDWRNTPGARELIPWLDKYYPVWGTLARAHGAAVSNGTMQPGEHDLSFQGHDAAT